MIALILLATYLGIGCLFVGLAVPLVQGKVKPNPWYGVRVRKTMQNPDTWYAVNAYFGRRFAVIGLMVGVIGLILSPLCFIPNVGVATYVFLGHGFLIGSLVWVTIDTFRYLRKY